MGAESTKENVKAVKLHFWKMREIVRTLQEYQAELRSDITTAGHAQEIRSGRTGDFTAINALRRIQEVEKIILRDGTVVEYPDRWIQVYLDTIKYFDDETEKQIIDLRLIQAKSVEWTLLKMGHLCKRTLFETQYRILFFAIGAACGRGLLKY